VDIQRFINLRNSPIAKNFFALSFLQLTNYIIPLIFIPYIIRVIGIEKFGLISLSQALMLLLAVIADYGFNLISTKEIAIHRDDIRKLSSIYSITLTSKLVLGFITFLILLLAIALIPKLKEESLMHGMAYLLVLGQLLFPVWLFQGLEKMQYISLLNLSSKLITLLCVILFVREPDDYIYVLPSYASGAIVASVVALIIARQQIGVTYSIVKYVEIKDALASGFSLFMSNVSVTLYNSTTVIILSMFASDMVVGYYSAAEKIMLVPRQLLAVFSQAIYPRVCLLASTSYQSLEELWNKLMPFFLGFVFLFCLLIFIFSDELTIFMTGESNPDITLLIRMLAFVPFVVSTNIRSYQTLLAYNLYKQCLMVLAFASVFHIVTNAILSYSLDAMGTAVSLLATEVIITFGLYRMRKRMERTNQDLTLK
jgi:polysaccharide transporter, PST family